MIESNIELYPIPVLTELNIKLKENKDYRVTLYDMKGGILENKTINSSASINMSHLPYGVYFIQVAMPDNSTGFIKRIVKQ